jgi:predicted MFS family arabinose efflux permease
LPAGSIEPIRHDLDLTYSQIGLLLVLLPAGGLVGGAFAVAADRVSRRAQAALGALGCAVGFAAFAVGQQLWVLAAGSFLVGMSSDAIVSACEVALVDLAGDDLVAVLAPGTVGAGVGDVLGPALLAATAVLGWSWRIPFAIGAAVFVVYAMVLAAQPIPPPRPDRPDTAVHEDIWACLRDKRVWWLALVSLLFDTLDEPLLGFAIAFLEEDRGQSHGLALVVGGSVVVGGIVGASALTVRRRPPTTSLATLSAVMAGSVLGIVIAPAVPLQLVAGLAAGIASAVFWTRVQAAMLGLRPGQAGTTAAVVGYLAMPSALVPLLAAALADRYGLGAALACYVVIALVLTAVAAVTPTGSSLTRPSTIR